ncbi:MAG: GNAT family N-acetyltransferase [archaeon]
MKGLRLKVVDADELKDKELKGLEEIGRKRKASIKGEKIILAEKEGKVVGYTSVVESPRKKLYIANMRVKEKERRKKIGEKMDRVIKNIAEEKGIKQIHAGMINPKAEKFWKSRKYKIKKEKGNIRNIHKKIKNMKKEPSSLRVSRILDKKRKRRKK